MAFSFKYWLIKRCFKGKLSILSMKKLISASNFKMCILIDAKLKFDVKPPEIFLCIRIIWIILTECIIFSTKKHEHNKEQIIFICRDEFLLLCFTFSLHFFSWKSLNVKISWCCDKKYCLNCPWNGWKHQNLNKKYVMIPPHFSDPYFILSF